MPTIGLVMDMIRKMPLVAIGFFDSMSIRPCASRCATRPLRATSVTAPEKLFGVDVTLNEFVDTPETVGGHSDVLGLRRGRRRGKRPDECGQEQENEQRTKTRWPTAAVAS